MATAFGQFKDFLIAVLRLQNKHPTFCPPCAKGLIDGVFRQL